MKRTATTMMLLAGFGGGCVSPDSQAVKKAGGYGTVTRPATIPNMQGPGGEPVAMTAARGAAPGSVQQASYVQPARSGVRTANGMTAAHIPGGYVTPANYNPPPGMPAMGGPPNGIYPVPGMGPPGAVAAMGAIGPGHGVPAGINGMRTSIRFTGPAGMKVTWQLPTGGFNDESSGLTAPKEYNFLQGQVYRLRLSQILPNFPGRTFYPTLEIRPANPKTITFLSHASVPITFTNEDFDQVSSGNLVVKVIYLPDPTFQDFAVVAGAEEIVSTRLEPGADPIAEAQRRGTVLAIIRLGNIDLENKASPAMTAPPPGMVPPGMVPPGGAQGRTAMPMAGAIPPGVANVNGPVAPTAPSGANTNPATPRPTAMPIPTAPSSPVAPGLLPNASGK